VWECEAGGARYAVCNTGEGIYVLDGVCPHAGGPLGHGALHGHMVVCPWHAWEFDCRTGEHDFNPSVRVRTFPARVEGDDILIEEPERA
jgi:nitrite reductase (NADH) small subunit